MVIKVDIAWLGYVKKTLLWIQISIPLFYTFKHRYTPEYNTNAEEKVWQGIVKSLLLKRPYVHVMNNWSVQDEWKRTGKVSGGG